MMLSLPLVRDQGPLALHESGQGIMQVAVFFSGIHLFYLTIFLPCTPSTQVLPGGAKKKNKKPIQNKNNTITRRGPQVKT